MRPAFVSMRLCFYRDVFAVFDDVDRRSVIPDRVVDVGLVQNDDVCVAANLQLVVLNAEHLCCGRRDHVIEQIHVVKRQHAEQMACKECDLQHVALAEGIVSILNVVLSERNGNAGCEQILDARCERAGVRVGDDADARLLEQTRELAEIVLRIQLHRAAVLCGHAALPAHGDGLLAEHLERALFRVADVVQQHGDRLIIFLCIGAHGIHMILLVLFGELDPRNTADHIRTEVERLLDQLFCAGFAGNAVLRESDDLQLNAALVFFAGFELP